MCDDCSVICRRFEFLDEVLAVKVSKFVSKKVHITLTLHIYILTFMSGGGGDDGGGTADSDLSSRPRFNICNLHTNWCDKKTVIKSCDVFRRDWSNLTGFKA